MEEFSVGQVVISRQGKDVGLEYVVSGLGSDGRIWLIRPPRFNVSNPKKKNPRHLQRTSKHVGNLAEYIKAGKNIDAGYFHRSLTDGE